jgi:hypothetical protein
LEKYECLTEIVESWPPHAGQFTFSRIVAGR